MDGDRFDMLTRALAAGITRRRVVGAAAGVLAAAFAPGRAEATGKKVTICHMTGSVTNPYVYILVSDNPNGPHSRHAGDVIGVDLLADPSHCGACGNSCDDGNACTIDSCVGGQCVQAPTDCSALEDQCNVGVCNPTDGACVAQPRPNGTRCGDGNACNGTETCQDGLCTPGTDVICQPLSQCHEAGVCDPATGLCSNPVKANGDACETGNQCTADTCQAGECQQGPVNVTCPLPTPCQQSVACNPATGVCDLIVNQPAGFACGASASCEGGVARAADVCDENGNCVPGPDTPCGPGEECDRDGTTCVPVACLTLQAACTPGGTPVDNGCCQDETTFCQDVPGCGGETQTQCCHVGNQSCSEACDCCGLDVCEGNRCCHPSGNACDIFKVNACCGQNVCDPGSGQCCRPEGARCSFFEVDDCCPGTECDGSFCSCRPPGEPCTTERDVCCIGFGDGGQCAALDGEFPSDNMVCCLFRGESCTSDSQCCQSEQVGIDIGCREGRCCSGIGDGCFRDEQCCGNYCCTEPECLIGLGGTCR